MLPEVKDYKVLELIGSGGFAEIFRAADRNGGTVVLKLLAPRFRGDKTARRALVHEGAMGARAGEHPHVVRTLGAGKCPSGPYLALEYVEGQSLRAAIRKGPIGEAEVVRMARELAKGLLHVHSRGMLHNDVKPENVFLSPRGVKVIDFGLASTTGFFSSLRRRPLEGTPSYVAPERLMGVKHDVRSDVYSAGATLYEALARRPPMRGLGTREILNQHLSRAPADPLRKAAPGTSMALADVIDRCIRKDPDERYRDFHEFLMALRRHPMYDSSARLTAESGPAG